MRSNNPTLIGTTDLRNFSLVLGALSVLGFTLTRVLGLEKVLAIARFSPLRCPLKFLGLSCPTCGLGHSVLAAFQGDWEASFHYHPLGMALVAFVLTFSITGIFFPRKLKDLIRRLPQRIPPRVYVSIAFLYLSWHLTRAGSPF